MTDFNGLFLPETENSLNALHTAGSPIQQKKEQTTSICNKMGESQICYAK